MAVTDPHLIPPDDLAKPRRPWWHRLLAAVLGLAAAAVYGLVVTAIATSWFLDEPGAARLRGLRPDVPPSVMLWLIVVVGTWFVGAHAAWTLVVTPLAARHGAAARSTTPPQVRRWSWPVILIGSPLLALGLALAGTQLIEAGHRTKPGEPAIWFAALAGCLLSAIYSTAWLGLVAMPTTPDTSHAPDNIESHWLKEATADAFWGATGIIGLGALVFSFWPVEADTSVVLLAVLCVVVVLMLLRLAVLRLRERRV